MTHHFSITQFIFSYCADNMKGAVLPQKSDSPCDPGIAIAFFPEPLPYGFPVNPRNFRPDPHGSSADEAIACGSIKGGT